MRSSAVERASPWAVATTVLACSLLTFPYFEATRNANERSRLLQGIALFEDRSFSIDGPSVAGIDPGPDVSRGADRGLYPNKPPGTSMVGALAYGLARAQQGETLTLRGYTWWARLLGGVLPTVALAGFAMWRHGLALGPKAVGAAVLLWALATPAAAYAHLFYGHQLAALLLFVGVSLIADARERGERRIAMIGGAIAGLAVTVEYDAAFAALPIAALLTTPTTRIGRAGVLGPAVVGALIPVGLLLAYHAVAFGSPFSTGYHHVVDRGFADKHAQGFLGLGLPTWDGVRIHLLSEGGGLLWWAPLLPVALFGLFDLARTPGPRRAEGGVWLAILLLQIAVQTALSFEGGWRVGPRYVVVALPALILGLARALALAPTSAPWTAVIVALGLHGTFVNALAANLWPHFDLSGTSRPVAEVLVPLVRGGYDPYSLPRWLLGVHGGTAVFAVVVALAVVCAALYRALTVATRSTVPITVGIALAIASAIHVARGEGTARSDGNLAYVESVWEPRLGSPAPAASVPLRRPGPVSSVAGPGR